MAIPVSADAFLTQAPSLDRPRLFPRNPDAGNASQKPMHGAHKFKFWVAKMGGRKTWHPLFV